MLKRIWRRGSRPGQRDLNGSDKYELKSKYGKIYKREKGAIYMKKVKEFISTTRGKASCIFIIIILICFTIILTQYPMSTKKAYSKFNSFSNQDEGMEWLNKVYDMHGLFGELERDRKIEVLTIAVDNIDNQFKSMYGGSIEDRNNVEITGVNIREKDYSSDYVDIEVTITNNSSKDIKYVQINLYYSDEGGNILKSEWTNDSAIIKPGASQIVSKMTKTDGWYNVKAEIETVKFK